LLILKILVIMFILFYNLEGIKVKKRTKLVLVALCMLALLTGCYKQDTVISVSPTGNIHATVSFMGTDDAVAQVSQGGTFEDF